MRNGLKLSYASTRAKTCIEGRTYKGGYMRKYKVKSTKLCSERSVVRHLRAVAAFGVACTYLMSGSVSAQNANNPPTPDGSSVYLIAKVQGEKNEISNDIDQASAKRDALTAKETQAETERDDIDHKARLFNDSPKSQQLLKEIASYRATCEGRRLYGADIARCDNAIASIKPRTEEHNRIFTDLMSRYNAKNALVQQIKQDRVLADTEITKLQNYLSWLKAAEEKLYASLAKSCTDMPVNATIEELKNRCGNVQFDFANEHLPECGTERCKAMVIYAKPARTPQQAIQEYINSGKPSVTPNPLLDKRSVPPPPK